MEAVADALVYAVSYINCRPLEDDELRYDDGDVGALESIAGLLANATPAEQDARSLAAERALADELASTSPRAEFVEDYSRWMHDIFGDEWRATAASLHQNKGGPNKAPQWTAATELDRSSLNRGFQ